jgi:hypothetical protein
MLLDVEQLREEAVVPSNANEIYGAGETVGA